jgi:hypothetical protein
VAGLAGDLLVASLEREHLLVLFAGVERRLETGEIMTGGAVSPIGPDRQLAHMFIFMAVRALSERDASPRCTCLVATGTADITVATLERIARQAMIERFVVEDEPARGLVTTLTVGPEPALMRILVARLAARPRHRSEADKRPGFRGLDIALHRVALRATDVTMAPGEGEARRLMIESGCRFPALLRVATLAGAP